MQENIPLKMNEEFNNEDKVKYNNSYMFIKGFAIAHGFKQTLIALAVARRMHEGQYRLDGSPYLLHPLKVCSTLYSYGIRDDDILAACILHDVIEDCQNKLPLGGKELISEYGINKEVYEIVKLVSKEPGLNEYELSLYFDKIKKNPKALLVKLGDRLHNSQTLYAFSKNKTKFKKYIKETNQFIIPMAQYGKSYYPQYTNELSILKSNIYSLNHSMEIIEQTYEEEINKLNKEIEEKNFEIKKLKDILSKRKEDQF